MSDPVQAGREKTVAASEHILDVLASSVRREILWLTWHDELTAGEIAQQFEVSGPTISQHLRVLREAGLVSQVVDGNFRRYRAVHSRLLNFEPYLRKDAVEQWVLSESLQPAGSEVRAETGHLARVRVALPVAPELAFTMCVAAEHLSAWCGENAQSDPRPGGQFQFDLMGRTCRGVYWRYHPPSVLVNHWGFSEAGKIPAPHDLFESALYFSPSATGCELEVQHLTSTAEEAEFMAMAWTDRLQNLRQLATAIVESD